MTYLVSSESIFDLINKAMNAVNIHIKYLFNYEYYYFKK